MTNEPTLPPAEPLITARAVCSRYPNFDLNYHTGGGCTAFMHELDDGGYLLVTTPDDPCAPSATDRYVAVGRYDAGSTFVGDETADSVIPVEELDAWINAQFAAVRAERAARGEE